LHHRIERAPAGPSGSASAVISVLEDTDHPTYV
jgi:hypothetical protein